MLQQSQDADGWGKKTLQRLAAGLKNDYSEIKGFTVRNMQYMVQFFNEYNQELTIWQQPVAKLEISNLALPVKQLSGKVQFYSSHQTSGLDAQLDYYATS